jgi:hypothetical protein
MIGLQEYAAANVNREKKTIEIGIISIWGNVLTHLNIYSTEKMECVGLLNYKWSNYSNNDIFLVTLNSQYSD